jgi:hypothetical protein
MMNAILRGGFGMVDVDCFSMRQDQHPQIRTGRGLFLTMIRSIESDHSPGFSLAHDLFGKPVSIPDQVRQRAFSGSGSRLASAAESLKMQQSPQEKDSGNGQLDPLTALAEL